MANYTTSYADDEEERMLREYIATQGGEQAPAAPPPVEPPPPVAMPEPETPPPAAPTVQTYPSAPPDDIGDPFEAYAQMQGPRMRGGSSYEAPPEVQAPDDKWTWIAGALDLVLNRGENLPTYVAQLARPDDSQYTNYKRRNEAMNDASVRDARAQSLQQRSGSDAIQQRRLQLAERNADLRGRQIDAQGESLEMRRQKQQAEMAPDSPEARRVADVLIRKGVPRESLMTPDGRVLSIYEQKQLSPAIKNEIEVAMSGQMAGVAAERARETAEATEASKIRVAEGTARATHPYKVDLARETAGIRTEDREAQAALAEEKDIGAERRKRMAAQERERTSLLALKARLEARDRAGKLPAQGSFIERGVIKAKSSVLGGTGMSEEDSRLDNDLTMAGLQSYITGAGNAPNSEREQEVAGRKFRADGTVGGALQAIDARLQEIDSGEQSLREREDAGRIRPPRRERPTPAPAADVEVDEEEGFRL